ncbi:hypothetical protein OG782_14030 [Streptomyces sp. NBC_00876]|uniref:hypothetical protein n=1 Tax=Streptomyces sp. NBC_00876 TaxID=2975853 RepID=UPI003868DA75|nr:hypothetical protein OG782_14030 [Streptomyces sp. NBC_00876]
MTTVSALPVPLAKLLWRQHAVYRERGGTVVIRGEDAGRWISLTSHGSGLVRVRAGRILDGGTTAPARAEATVPLDGDITRLAACCRGLLAETADARTGETGGPSTGRGRQRQASRQGSRKGPRQGSRRGRRGRSAAVLVCAAVVVGLIAASMFG